MSKATHTPGPWNFARLEYPADEDVSFEITAGRHLVLQSIMREKKTEAQTIAQDEANVILAAAAPELLEALMCAYSVLAAAFNRIHELPRTADTALAKDIGNARARISAAISKAEGAS